MSLFLYRTDRDIKLNHVNVIQLTRLMDPCNGSCNGNKVYQDIRFVFCRIVLCRSHTTNLFTSKVSYVGRSV